MSTPEHTEAEPDPDIMSVTTPRASERSLSRARSIFARRSSALSPEEAGDLASGIRYLQLNDHIANAEKNFKSNTLRSAKYTPLNILPKALFEQFRRVSNFYFLVIAAISFIPNISPTSSIAQVLPLFVIVGFGLARDVYEDVQRSLEDARQNSEIQVVMARAPDNVEAISKNLKPLSKDHIDELHNFHLDPDIHRTIASRNIAVGDFVFVRKGQVFPCDLVLLHSSGEGGVAYVSTANLDGESNLKRVVVATPAADIATPSQLRSLPGKIRAQKPTTALHEFEASMTLDGQDPAPLDASNLLLRGSILRNTDYIYGVTVYTGFDTKVALNMRHPPSKMGSIERKLNLVVVFLFVILAILVITVSAASGILQNSDGAGQWYMGENRLITGTKAGVRGLGTFLILFSTFIPVSLFVTLEFIRVLQALFMTADFRMKTGDQSVVARATNLNEMLGEVEHILSDKTGTLTENIMRYIACSAGGKVYNVLKKPRAMQNALTAGVQPIRDLVLSMALCHSVVPEPKADNAESDDGKKKGKKKRKKDRDSARSHGTTVTNESIEIRHEGALSEKPGGSGDGSAEALTEYQGQSPDEVALVSSAREFGITLLRRTLDTVVVDHFGTEETYTALAELEFNSDRKRMSTILRCPDGRIRMITKGADTIMLQILEQGTDLDLIQSHIDEFAKEGLRTLVFTMKELTEEVFTEWFERFQDARNSLEGRDEKVSSVSAEIETDLVYVATTAVEDKLQDKVPETIKFMREAGVKLWVLTGDKRETAENIGYSANLLHRQMDVVHIKGTNTADIEEQLSETLDRHIGDDDDDVRLSMARRSSLAGLSNRLSITRKKSVEEKELGIIIDGASLHFAIEDHSELFMAVSDHTKVVICCRVTPLQKALVVRLVREKRKSTTLAIGDGGNDVSMIQEAHIGVGIFGKEGSQAARSADYALGEFKHLLRLTALHGRYCGVRTAGMINLSFYKNIFFTLTQVFFQAFDFASGQTFNNQWVTSAFNVVVTSASPFLFGIFERDLDESTAVQFPSVYASNRDRQMFSLKSVIEYTMLYGVWHAIVVFFGVYITFGYLKVDFRDGKDSGMFLVGFANSTLTMLMVLFKILLHSHTLNWIVLLAMVLSVALYVIVAPAAIYVVNEYPLEGQLGMLFSSPTFYLAGFVIMTASFLLDFVVLIGRQMFAPNVVDRLQQWERDVRKNK